MLYIYHMNFVQMYYLNDDSLAFNSVAKFKEALSARLSVSTSDILLLKDSQKLQDSEMVSHYNVGLVESNPIFVYTTPATNTTKCLVPCIRNEFKTQLDLVQRESSFKSQSTFFLRNNLRTNIIDRSSTLHSLLKSVSNGILHHNKAWSSLLAAGKSLKIEVRNSFEKSYDAYQLRYEAIQRESHKEIIAKLGKTLKFLRNHEVPDALSHTKSSRRLVFSPETTKRRRLSSSSTGIPVMLGEMSFSDEDDHVIEEISSTVPPMSIRYNTETAYGSQNVSWYEPVDNLFTLMFAEAIEDIVSRAEKNIFMESEVDHNILEKKEAEILDKFEEEINLLNESCDVTPVVIQIQTLFLQFEQIVEIQTMFSQKPFDENWIHNDPEIMEKTKREVSDLLAMNERLNTQIDITENVLELKDEVIERFDGLLKKYSQCCQKLRKNYYEIRSYHELLNRKQMSIQSIDFLSQIPSAVFLGIAEVIRRRNYSKNFLKWAEPLQAQVNELLQKETARRKYFHKIYQRFSFLCLFDGLDAGPSMYAAVKPVNPDDLLPQLTDADLETLISKWPCEFEHLLSDIDEVEIPALLRSSIQTSTLRYRPCSRSYQPEDLVHAKPGVQTVVMGKNTQKDYQERTEFTNRLEEKMEQLLEENTSLKNKVKILEHKLVTANEKYCLLDEGKKLEIDRLVAKKLDHEIAALKAELENEKCREIEQCRSLLEAQKDVDYLNNFKEKEKHIKADYEKEKQRLEAAKKAEIECLIEKHRMEVDTLRQRFKMMTTASMDKSPSDSSLPDSERLQADAMLRNQKEELQTEMEKRLASQKEAFEIQLGNKESFYKAQREVDFKRIQKEHQVELEKALESVKKNKDDLLQSYQFQITNLSKRLDEAEALSVMLESQKNEFKILASEYKRTKKIYKEVQRVRLSERSEYHDRNSVLNFLDICDLRNQFVQKIDFMETILPIQINNNINIIGCAPDEIVMFHWSKDHNAYKAFITGTLSLLDPSCHPFFNISTDLETNKAFYLGEVVRQEYSATKREGNRFNLSQGAVFYRVYARPPGSSFVPRAPRKKHSESSRKIPSLQQSPRRRTESESDLARLETFRSQDIEDDWTSAIGSLVSLDTLQFSHDTHMEKGCDEQQYQCHSHPSKETYRSNPFTSDMPDCDPSRENVSSGLSCKRTSSLKCQSLCEGSMLENISKGDIEVTSDAVDDLLSLSPPSSVMMLDSSCHFQSSESQNMDLQKSPENYNRHE